MRVSASGNKQKNINEEENNPKIVNAIKGIIVTKLIITVLINFNFIYSYLIIEKYERKLFSIYFL